LIRRSFVRPLLASAAIAAALALAACETDGTAPSARSMQPISDKMLAEIEKKNMTRESPILVRLFKEEAELEVWKQDQTGRFALLKTYPICRWSGELGPKIKEGDRQAPEGFYAITPSLLNPHSSYYLAINMGFPNAYDRAHNRTGAFLMIHGDCSSRGCYAMTDEQIAEIYALARESFFGGQRTFQVQAYPFRMTAANMARHRNSPHMAFWKMLKQGNDHFEVSRMEPKVDVCERRYVFNAYAPGNPDQQLRFNPTGACPVYEVPAEIAAAVRDKTRRDEAQMATLIRATPAAPVKTGLDGGMNRVFLAALQPKDQFDTDGRVRALAPVTLPGTIPPHTVPPGEQWPIGAVNARARPADAPPAPGATTEPTQTASINSQYNLAAADQRPAPAPAAKPANSQSLFGNLFSNDGKSDQGVLDRVARAIGLKNNDPPPMPASEVPTPRAKPSPKRTANAPGAIRPQAQTEPAPAPNPGAIRRAPKEPQNPPVQTATSAPAPNPAITGAQPTMPAGTFSNRWGAFQ
jgi:murein L,D-transpeptidase YafK